MKSTVSATSSGKVIVRTGSQETVFANIGSAAEQIAMLQQENERLRAEVIERCEAVLYAAGYEHGQDEFKGWVDTCAMSSAQEAGDRLVELGLWERHPKGFG